MRHRRTALFILLLLALFFSGAGLWVRAQQNQYALNGQLIVALFSDDTKQILALLNAGADPNTRNQTAPAPSFQQLVKQLLHPAPAPDNNNPTALWIASGVSWDYHDPNMLLYFNRPDEIPIMQALLRHGANVNVATPVDGSTMLMSAVQRHHLPTVCLLLENGAQVNAQDEGGRTALHYAVESGAADAIIAQLLVHRADPNLADEEAETPLMLARKKKRPDTITLLRQAGARK